MTWNGQNESWADLWVDVCPFGLPVGCFSTTAKNENAITNYIL